MTGFLSPFYTDDQGRRRRTYSQKNVAGVYLIKEDGVIVYVGMSRRCVLTACYRHFYKWSGKWCSVTYKDRLQSRNYEIVILVTTPDEAPLLEQGIVFRMRPRDNREKFDRLFGDMPAAPDAENCNYEPVREEPEEYEDLPF